MNEGYFRLFLKTKMGIFLNYGGTGSHHGGAGRITPHMVRATFSWHWAAMLEIGLDQLIF